MNRLRRRTVSAWVTLVVAQLPHLAWAQQTEEAAEASKSWVPAYFLVGLCIGVGLFVICRPSLRRAEIRRLE